MPPQKTSVCVYIGTAACLIQILHKDARTLSFLCVSHSLFVLSLFQSLIHQTFCKPAVTSRPSNETVTGVIEAIRSLKLLLLRHQNE